MSKLITQYLITKNNTPQCAKIEILIRNTNINIKELLHHTNHRLKQHNLEYYKNNLPHNTILHTAHYTPLIILNEDEIMNNVDKLYKELIKTYNNLFYTIGDNKINNDNPKDY